jgi:hypothetical protein
MSDCDPPRQWSATGPLEFVNLVYSRKTCQSALSFDRILTTSGLLGDEFGTLPAKGVRKR